MAVFVGGRLRRHGLFWSRSHRFSRRGTSSNSFMSILPLVSSREVFLYLFYGKNSSWWLNLKHVSYLNRCYRIPSVLQYNHCLICFAIIVSLQAILCKKKKKISCFSHSIKPKTQIPISLILVKIIFPFYLFVFVFFIFIISFHVL